MLNVVKKQLEKYPEDPELWYKCGIWHLRSGLKGEYHQFWLDFIENPPSRQVKKGRFGHL